MADVASIQVKVGADIAELMSKVDAAKAKLNQLSEGNQELKNSITNLNDSLKFNERRLADVGSQLSKLVSSGKGASAEAGILRKEFSKITAESTAFSSKLAITRTQLADNSIQLKNQTAAVKGLEKSMVEAGKGSTGFAAGAGKAFSALRSLANIIPGIGIGGLVGLIAGPLVDAFSDWFESITKVNDATKLLKAQQADFNDVMKDANKDAAKQTVDLQLLYGAATNVNLSMKDRLSAAKALNAEFPETFKNFTAEEIALGKAKSAYDETTLAILRQSRAKAVKGKLDEITTAQLDNDIKRQQLLIETGKKLIEISKRGEIRQDVGAGVSVVVSHSQAEAAINESTRVKLKLIDNDNKILEERKKFISSFLDLPSIAPDTGRLKEIDDQIKFLKSQKELHASTLAEVKDFNAKIEALQKERDTIDPPKVNVAKAAKTVKDIETIGDVLDKLRIQIDFLNQKEITLNVNESAAKIAEIEKTINTLLQKFKLTADSTVIINLKAQINDIQLTEQFKKALKFDKNKPITIPQEIIFSIQPPTVDFPPGTFDEQIFRDEILKKLKRLGITKTIPIKIGVDVTGVDIIAGSEDIGANVSTVKLEATLKRALEVLKDFNDQINDSLKQISVDVFAGLGEALGKGITGEKDIFKGLFDGIFSSLADEISALGKALIKAGIQMKLAKDAIAKLGLSPLASIAVGIGLIALAALLKAQLNKQVSGFARGGEIKGHGTGTSDSMLIRASRGEYIVRAEVVKQMGVPFFDKLNRGIKPVNYVDYMAARGLNTPRFAGGGLVITPNVKNTNNGLGEININSQQIEVTGEFKIRNDHLVAAVKQGTNKINRNS